MKLEKLEHLTEEIKYDPKLYAQFLKALFPTLSRALAYLSKQRPQK